MKKPVKLIGLAIVLVVAMLLSGCGGPAKTYENAQKALVNGEYAKAAELFESISTYEDSSKLAMYSKALLYGEQKNYDKAIDTLVFLQDFKDSGQLIEYYAICKLSESMAMADVLSAAEQFDAISAFRDSAARAETCRQIAYDKAASQFNDGEYESAQWIYSHLKSYKDSEVQVQACISSIKERENSYAYAKAEKLLSEGKYDDAANAFKALGDYKDSSKRIKDAIEAKNADSYENAERLLEDKQYVDAVEAFLALGDYKDSASRVEEATEKLLEHAEVLSSEGNYDDAISALAPLGYDSSVSDVIMGIQYQKACYLMDNEDYTEAVNCFMTIDSYKDAQQLIAQCQEKRVEKDYLTACEYMQKNKNREAVKLFESLGQYKDSFENARKCVGNVLINGGANDENKDYAVYFYERNKKNFVEMPIDDLLSVLNKKDIVWFMPDLCDFGMNRDGVSGARWIRGDRDAYIQIVNGEYREYTSIPEDRNWDINKNYHKYSWYQLSSRHFIVDNGFHAEIWSWIPNQNTSVADTVNILSSFLH